DNKGRLRGPIGMAVIPAGHALLSEAVRGVVVASKGKISAILDRDGDDVAETERVIATGWKEIPQNVDAIGVAIHPDDGAIFFGLGTAAYNNAYLLDESGQSAFDLASERGTIQRIAPDLSRRETVCTGVRFTIGLEFNADKELFATDQEGATWLPNGNPFDELLHIQPNRHYGFPPRHPKHLPSVLDEPSLFDYAPQHQSTCGMAFNLPLEPNGPIFGPAAWRGDALVTGESRGKLYRTRLTRDDDGRYVAENQLIACLNMLTVDCCLSPRGDLLVACHSGGPDWGTGPSGKGKIYGIRYELGSQPQPLAAWAAGPQEVRVTFDRPLDPQQLKNLAAQARITYGEYVAAGDRFESVRPGYAVTQLQQSTPRYRLPIYSASVTPDRRTLMLSIAPHPTAATYALTLPGFGRESKAASAGELPQHPQIDLAYSLHGVHAIWEPRDKSLRSWEGWLPHLDFAISRAWRTGDAEQDRFWEVIEQPGTLTLTTQLDARGLLYPTVQPGSKLDYDREADRWIKQQSLLLQSTRPFAMTLGSPPRAQAVEVMNGRHQAAVVLEQTSSTPVPLSLRLETGGAPPSLTPSWQATLADGETRTGSLPLRRWLLPWADIEPAEKGPTGPRVIPELAGASWGRGRRVFFSEEAGCAKCHIAHRTGGQIGADLSNLIHRDYASVLRDIAQPSFAINPDFVSYTAILTDGRVLTGALRSDGDKLLIGDKDGRVTAIARSDIEELHPAAVSVMPEGLPQKLGPERMKDLLAFLLLEPPRMPHDAPLPAPPPRRRAEVAAVLAGTDGAASPSGTVRPLNVLLVAGAKDHGPGEHDYPAWLRAWSELLAGADGVTVSTAMEWPSPGQLRSADIIAFFQKGSWTLERAEAIDAHLAKGGGLVYIHWAVEGGPEAPAFAQRIGLASHAAKIKYRHGPLDLGFESGHDHPIGRNFDKVHFHDESYWLMLGDPSQIRVIATGIEDGEPRPLFWCLEPKRGRVFVSILGHYSWTFDDPLFRILLLRGLAWSAKESVDRFHELATLGVPLTD
ncbi:MAG TPA: ThuA domain-containing protein, partial [Planctomycetaceae bacterium]|nr:ThuA domain-containing protein [Planctomycetaceae bacterium]